MISFVSIKFLLFSLMILFLYFAFPAGYKWLVLLGGSLYFYSCTGIMNLVFVLVSAAIVYIVTGQIENIYNSSNPEKKKAKKQLILGIGMLISLLVFTKTGKAVIDALNSFLFNRKIDFNIFVPVGISYYTFSVIGYMADVYWKREVVEHNYLKLLLYMIYFPHIFQGPIPRHRRLAPQLSEGHDFNYQSLCFGLQRMIWGYFKKLVITDRLSLFTGEVFENYVLYEGLVFVVAIGCSAIELYCDFSGCMDIVLGISEVMGIKLDENFRRPFFSKSAAEFWRRWHITLGEWFKDYVYMPLVINPKLIKLCQKTRGKLGNRFARNLLMAISMASVWILTGLWHSTGWNYIIWGCYWGILINLSTVFTPGMRKLTKRMQINTESKKYGVFRVIRTFLLFLISRLLTAPGDIQVTGEIIHRMFSKWNPEVFFNQTFFSIGWDRFDFWVCAIAILILWVVESMQEKGISIRNRIAAYPVKVRWGIYYAAILSIFIFGIYSSDVAKDTFIYMNF